MNSYGPPFTMALFRREVFTTEDTRNFTYVLRKTFADALTSRRFFEVMFVLYDANIGKIILLEEKRIVLKNGEAYKYVKHSLML